jgi:hypothetical protein
VSKIHHRDAEAAEISQRKTRKWPKMFRANVLLLIECRDKIRDL